MLRLRIADLGLRIWDCGYEMWDVRLGILGGMGHGAKGKRKYSGQLAAGRFDQDGEAEVGENSE